MTVRIACSPLTGRIFRGTINKAGTAFTGSNKVDVTGEVIGAMYDMIEFKKGRVPVTCNGVLIGEITFIPAQTGSAKGGDHD